MKRLILPLAIMLSIARLAQAADKTLIDYFQPMPIISPLTSDTWGAPNVFPRDTKNGLEDTTMKKWCYWDGQIIKAKDGKYHIFASRWDQAKGHKGWGGSVAVHAVSDTVLGPYVDKGLCWPENQGGKGHNVTALVLPDGRYAVVVSETRPGDVFVSKSLDGPWDHLGKITVAENEFSRLGRMSNVAVMVRPDGDCMIVPRSGTIMISKKGILGPYTVMGPSVYSTVTGLSLRNLEDPVIWHSGGLYHIVVNSWSARKAFHITSPDGIKNWTFRGLAYDPTKDFVRYTDGTVNHWNKMERPGVLLENGHVTHFTFAVIDVPKEQDRGNDNHGSKILIVPFDGAAMDRDLQGAADAGHGASKPRRVVFEGVKSEHHWPLKELNPDLPADWTDHRFLVLELKTATPQRFSLYVYTTNGPRRIMLQPFGQNVWLRASVPLRYLRRREPSGFDLASANNRRSDTFWMSVWGPFGDLTKVESLGLSMDYPLPGAAVEIRSVKLAKDDPGSDFLEGKPVLDEFRQWAHADWPRKVKSREQLAKELADEEKTLQPGDFGYCEYGGYKNTHAKATGFFRVEQIDGKWWFVDPHGHLFLSQSSNGLELPRFGRFGGNAAWAAASPGSRTSHRLAAWGFNTGAQWMNKPYITYVRARGGRNMFLGLPDVYSDEFARGIDEAAARTCGPRKNDPLLLGYFIGNEPPWDKRESEVVDMILAGPATATQAKAKEFLAAGDTPLRRKEFVVAAFAKQIEIVGAAIRKYDPNHLNLGIRFGGSPSDEVLRVARVFDVCSINVYDYEPTKRIERTYRVTGRPVLIGEFHFGVPANGLGAGLVQTRDQVERGKGYRYYVENAAALPGFVGAHWFTWRDEPVLGRMDGENYNIGLVDVTDRPYPELVEAAKATHRRLFDVHTGKLPAFNERPMASDAGTPGPRRGN